MAVVKITNTAVLTATCPFGKKKITLFDQALKGFICEIHASGHRTFGLRYRDPDRTKQLQYRIGDASVLTADQARKIALQVKARVLTGESPQEKRQAKRKVPTLAELSVRYLEHARSYKRAPGIDERALRLHLLPKFGSTYIDKLDQREIVQWLGEKVREGFAQATVNRWQVILGAMLRLAKKWGVPGAERNVMEGAKLKEPNNKIERYLTPDEVRRLKDAVERSENPMLSPIVALLLNTGARKREVLDATWDQFDLDRRSWRIERTKNGHARHVPLSDDAIAVLRSLPQIDGCPYVVPNLKTLKPHGSIFQAWNTARKRAGLKDVRVHDLRHTLASQLAQSGHSLWVIANVLGHRQTKTTERYAHLSNDVLRDAVNTASKVSGTNWAPA